MHAYLLSQQGSLVRGSAGVNISEQIPNLMQNSRGASTRMKCQGRWWWWCCRPRTNAVMQKMSLLIHFIHKSSSFVEHYVMWKIARLPKCSYRCILLCIHGLIHPRWLVFLLSSMLIIEIWRGISCIETRRLTFYPLCNERHFFNLILQLFRNRILKDHISN